MIAAVLLLMGAAPGAAMGMAGGCAIDHARYVLRSDSSFVLRSHVVPRTSDWGAGLAIELDRGRTGKVSWWLPMAEGSSDRLSWAWTAVAGTPQAAADYPYRLRSFRYLGFDPGYAITWGMLKRGDGAPAHIYLDDLREAFWYADDPAARESPPPALFDLAGCDVPADSPNVILPHVP